VHVEGVVLLHGNAHISTTRKSEDGMRVYIILTGLLRGNMLIAAC